MSFVNLVTEDQAGPELKKAYQEVKDALGFLPNYTQALGRVPALIEGHKLLTTDVMKDGALPRMVKEQLGLVVSGINSSSYCVAIHMEILRGLGVEKPMGRTLATDYGNAPVEEKVQVLFRFADKLTRKPFDVTRADADAVLRAGWSEAALFELAITVAIFNLYNRISIGLGLMADF